MGSLTAERRLYFSELKFSFSEDLSSCLDKTDQKFSLVASGNDPVAERAGSVGQCPDPTNLNKMP